MNDKSRFIRIGDFFFKWRNQVFPLILATLFLTFTPTKTALALSLPIVGLGLATRFATIGWAYIKRGGKAKQVYADDLVTTGYFGLCRNPLYVGNLLIYLGCFLYHGNAIVILAGGLTFLLIYSAIVAAEEHFLRAKFGKDYDAYAARVPRWLPLIWKHKAVTQGMGFSLQRALTKDYTTIASTLTSLGVIHLLRIWEWHPNALPLHTAISLVLAGALLFLTLTIRRYKRSLV
ncbi:methyltransferase family protein [Neogemmobacter tilapiae]|uniref:Lipid A Kdo2 1-phosphate O-methyltransferase n=1 Tax=Neogemmobacter tilapiae TaxID=875041 RepID=A0A918WLW7_9RHOB|nr:isoprenylcysteine carboxylmethyltransferase family protein [Gemmobacter tilapiae]GHC58838.1 lipid A Kdo2 1-phosphate O-methyltransferase [Gemmobacter tilapiae]